MIHDIRYKISLEDKKKREKASKCVFFFLSWFQIHFFFVPKELQIFQILVGKELFKNKGEYTSKNKAGTGGGVFWFIFM